MRKLIVICSTFLLLVLSVLPIHAIDVPESVDTYFYDPANVISEDNEYYLSEKDYYMDQHSGAYIEVVAVDYIHSDILDYAYTMFNEWGIGSSSKNNGILLLAVIQEEKYYVMVGRGLESKISAARIDDILETYFEPYFDQEQFETAIMKTFDVLYDELVSIYGTPKMQTTTQPTSSRINVGMILFWFVFILVIIIVISVLMSRPRARRYPTYGPVQPTYRRRPTTTYRPRPTHHSPPSYRPSTTSRPSVTSRPSSSRPSVSSSSRSSFGSRSRGGSSRGFGGGRR